MKYVIKYVLIYTRARAHAHTQARSLRRATTPTDTLAPGSPSVPRCASSPLFLHACTAHWPYTLTAHTGPAHLPCTLVLPYMLCLTRWRPWCAPGRCVPPALLCVCPTPLAVLSLFSVSLSLLSLCSSLCSSLFLVCPSLVLCFSHALSHNLSPLPHTHKRIHVRPPAFSYIYRYIYRYIYIYIYVCFPALCVTHEVWQ